MRSVIFAINITFDGCCDHTKMIADEEMHEYFTHVMPCLYGNETPARKRHEQEKATAGKKQRRGKGRSPVT